MASTNNFQQDCAEVCAICLDPLESTSTSESESKQIITLHCGHSYHRVCIIDQIKACNHKTARNDDQRILFNSFQCSLCASVIRAEDHPDELPDDLFRTSDELRSKVDTLIEEHGLRDEVEREMFRQRQKGPDGERKKSSHETLDREIMRKYAFYCCSNSSCGEPFYGGMIECADAFQTTSNSTSTSTSTNTSPEQKLCPACAPQPQSVCRQPAQHASYLRWKCRYCCQPATYLCYGNVHFCNECHEKNSTKKGNEKMKVTHCPGASCPHPKPNPNSQIHSNGPTDKSEQVYSCAICSTSTPDGDDPTRIRPGSRNFVVNPCGKDGLRGWNGLSRSSFYLRAGKPPTWEVEDLPTVCFSPVFPTPVLRPAGAQAIQHQHQHQHQLDRDQQPIATNFVSSYYWCTMAQSIDLSQFLRLDGQKHAAPTNAYNYNNSESSVSPVVRIEVSARYTQRTGIPSFFKMDAILADGQLEVERKSTGQLDTDVLWERTSLVFELGTLEDIKSRYQNSPVMTVEVSGKDNKFWAGPYGSKVTDICVRVLGNTPEEIDALVRN